MGIALWIGDNAVKSQSQSIVYIFGCFCLISVTFAPSFRANDYIFGCFCLISVTFAPSFQAYDYIFGWFCLFSVTCTLPVLYKETNLWYNFWGVGSLHIGLVNYLRIPYLQRKFHRRGWCRYLRFWCVEGFIPGYSYNQKSTD